MGRLTASALDHVNVYARRRTNLPRGFDWLLDVERLLELTRPAVAFDVGANVGQTTKAIKRRLPTATVHAFEPVSSTFDALSATVRRLDGVHCHRLALSDHQGHQTIPVVPGSVFNSLTSTSWPGVANAVDEEVELDTLDHFIEARGLGPIDLLKIDTEGHDLSVLRGATRALEAPGARCIYVEVTFSETNPQNTPFAQVFSHLEPMGYRFMGLYEMDYFQINPWERSFCNALFWKPSRELWESPPIAPGT